MKIKLFALSLIIAMIACSGVRTPATSVITVRPVIGDDTAVIQAAFDRLTDGLANHDPAYLVFEPGVYEVTGQLDLKNKYRAVVDGRTAVLKGAFAINMSGSYIEVRDLYLSQTPYDKPLIIYGRNGNGTGGNVRLRNVQAHADNPVSSILWAQADNSLLEDCEIWNFQNAPSLILTSENETGLLDWQQSTETFVRVTGGWIHGNGDVLVSMRGMVQNVEFDSVFFSPAEYATAAVELTAGEAHNLSFYNSRSEGWANAVLFRVQPGTMASVIDLTNYVHAVVNADYILDVRGTLLYLTADPFITRSSSRTQLANVTGEMSMMDDYLKQPETRIVTNYFSYSAPVLILDNANLTHLAVASGQNYTQVTIVFDGVSSIGGGYFIGLPSDPYVGNAGEVIELISLDAWYWTVK